MKTYLHEQEMAYDGTQLSSHFAYKNFGLQGDSIVAFIGPCQVTCEHLVDLEDVRNNDPIYSESMVHFIVEHFEGDLLRTIAYQRLLISIIIDELHDTDPELRLLRKGDDIFDDMFKVSVSIATSSPVSHMIHTGINISSHNTPVPTKGLKDYGMNPYAFATGVMNRYRAEIEDMQMARTKVRGCP